MAHHEPWLTALFNDHLANLGNSILAAVGTHAANPLKPWTTPVVMQLLVALIIIVLFALLRSRLSVDKPGVFQHCFELVYGFLYEQTEENIAHHAKKYLPFFITLFIFILFANLLGMIPGFESPTMFAEVPLGLAVITFIYYHVMGVIVQGPLKYLLHFTGPVWWLAPLMFPIEIISHFARPLSLTIRLYANMFAGEQVTIVFLGLVPLVIPVIFMGLHLFVAFLQAYIFTLLAMIYVGGAVEHEH